MDVLEYSPAISIAIEKPVKVARMTGTIRSTKQPQLARSTILHNHELEPITPPTTESSTVSEREISAREIEIDEDYRHWSPASQPYTTAEVLLQYLRCGWECMNQVTVKTSRCVSSRCVELYSFEIYKEHERLCVSVVSNPVILRLIHERGLIVTYCEINSSSSVNHNRPDTDEI